MVYIRIAIYTIASVAAGALAGSHPSVSAFISVIVGAL